MEFPRRLAIVTLILGLAVQIAVARVQVGIDVLASHNFAGLEGKRVGLITNPTGVSASGNRLPFAFVVNNDRVGKLSCDLHGS